MSPSSPNKNKNQSKIVSRETSHPRHPGFAKQTPGSLDRQSEESDPGAAMPAGMTSAEYKNVSRETFLRLQEYATLLLKWNQKINLIGKTTENELWARHIEDSLQLLPLLPSSAATLADFGSGAGLPGLVIAIARPDISVTLIEQDQRKSAFLSEAKRALGLSNVTVLARDIHSVDGAFDIVTARALAPLSELCALAYPRLGKNAICLFPKGENFASELEEAGDKWQFKHHATPSQTNEKSCIVSLSELCPK